MIEEKVLDYVKEQARALIAAPSVCKEAKAAAEKWLAAVGTENEKAETAAFVKELEEDLETIDQLIGFVDSPLCKQLFGEEKAAAFAAHAHELKENGAKYCDCPACVACANILSHKEELLK